MDCSSTSGTVQLIVSSSTLCIGKELIVPVLRVLVKN